MNIAKPMITSFSQEISIPVEESSTKNIFDINCLKSLIKVITCFKNSKKPTCIDLILTNRLNLFQLSNAFETGLSGLHILAVTNFQIGFQKLMPKLIVYRDYKNFDSSKFRSDIVTATCNLDNFSTYKSTTFNIVNHHIPINKKYIRANEAPFISKEFHKAIMKRSRLRNIFLKHRTNTNKKTPQHLKKSQSKTLEKHEEILF